MLHIERLSFIQSTMHRPFLMLPPVEMLDVFILLMELLEYIGSFNVTYTICKNVKIFKKIKKDFVKKNDEIF